MAFLSLPLFMLDYPGKEPLSGLGALHGSSPAPNQAGPWHKGSTASPPLLLTGLEPGEKLAAPRHPDMFIAPLIVDVCFYSGSG